MLLDLHTLLDANFLSCFADVKTPHPMKDVNSLMKGNTQPQASWSLMKCETHSIFSPIGLFATPWTIASQAPLSMGILQARILEWVARPSSILQPKNWQCSPLWHLPAASPSANQNCTQADHRPCNSLHHTQPNTHLAFKNALPKPFWELEAF